MSIFDADTDYGSDADEPVSPAKVRRMRCGVCDGCRAPECGECPPCKDKIKNGGTGKIHRACRKRRCIDMQPRPPARPRVNRNMSERDMLESLALFVMDSGGDRQSVVDDWRVAVETRKGGATAGTRDIYYYNDKGKRFRSKTEVARYLGLDVPPAKRHKGE